MVVQWWEKRLMNSTKQQTNGKLRIAFGSLIYKFCFTSSANPSLILEQTIVLNTIKAYDDRDTTIKALN